MCREPPWELWDGRTRAQEGLGGLWVEGGLDMGSPQRMTGPRQACLPTCQEKAGRRDSFSGHRRDREEPAAGGPGHGWRQGHCSPGGCVLGGQGHVVPQHKHPHRDPQRGEAGCSLVGAERCGLGNPGLENPWCPGHHSVASTPGESLGALVGRCASRKQWFHASGALCSARDNEVRSYVLRNLAVVTIFMKIFKRLCRRSSWLPSLTTRG